MPECGGAHFDCGFQFFVYQLQPSFAIEYGFLNPSALGDIIEAVDGSNDFCSIVSQRSNIHDDDNPGTIGALNMDFRILDNRHLAREHIAHRTLLVWHKTAV